MLEHEEELGEDGVEMVTVEVSELVTAELGGSSQLALETRYLAVPHDESATCQ